MTISNRIDETMLLVGTGQPYLREAVIFPPAHTELFFDMRRLTRFGG